MTLFIEKTLPWFVATSLILVAVFYEWFKFLERGARENAMNAIRNMEVAQMLCELNEQDRAERSA